MRYIIENRSYKLVLIYDLHLLVIKCSLMCVFHLLQNDNPSSFGVDIMIPSDVHPAIVTTESK